jgi:endonuclease G
MADLTYFPRLADLRTVGRAVERESAASITLEARRSGPRVTPKETLENRTGYEPDFLGEFVVPWPTLIGAKKHDVVPVAGSPYARLNYTHFSVTMSAARRMAIFVGVNIDGGRSQSIPRTNDKWSLDGRIAIDQQLGEDLYSENLLDRGHLVRREDPNWGDDAPTANEDTFHFTNCAPQMSGFNQKTWLSLEKHVLDNTRRWKERVTVFSGPVFRDDDRPYRGALIPTAFWKVIAFVSDDGKPSATAYMIDQKRELGSLEAAFGAFKTYQRSLRQIELLTDIDFGALSQYDGFSNEELATGTKIESELRSPAEMRV